MDFSMTLCHGKWTPANHALFQAAHASILISYMAAPTVYGVLFLHTTLVLGFVLLTTWGWLIKCSPDILSWNCSFAIINSIQMLLCLYRLRPIRFHPDIELVYKKLFDPLNVPRYMFQKLVSYKICGVLPLKRGDHYADENVTATDRLALLLEGTASVSSQGRAFQHIHQMEFFDSPEFDSAGVAEEAQFQVTIQALTPCRYMVWRRSALEHLFDKEPYLGRIMENIIARDVNHKLRTLTAKVHLQLRTPWKRPESAPVDTPGHPDRKTLAATYPFHRPHVVEHSGGSSGDMADSDNCTELTRLQSANVI